MGDYEIAVLFQGVQYTDTANATNAALVMNSHYGIAYEGYPANGSKYQVSVQQNPNGAFLNFEAIE